MCGVKSCPLAWREVARLRMLINDLTESGDIDLMAMQTSAGLLLYDVCTILGLEPRDVLGLERIRQMNRDGLIRLWPTLTEAEDEELAETDAIRQPEYLDEQRPGNGDISLEFV